MSEPRTNDRVVNHINSPERCKRTPICRLCRCTLCSYQVSCRGAPTWRLWYRQCRLIGPTCGQVAFQNGRVASTALCLPPKDLALHPTCRGVGREGRCWLTLPHHPTVRGMIKVVRKTNSWDSGQTPAYSNRFPDGVNEKRHRATDCDQASAGQLRDRP